MNSLSIVQSFYKLRNPFAKVPLKATTSPIRWTSLFGCFREGSFQRSANAQAKSIAYCDLPAREVLARLTGETEAALLMERYASLAEIARANEDELRTIPGIGARKAKVVKSAFSLAAKLSQEVGPDRPLMDTPERVADLLREELRLQRVETFVVLLLNTRQRLIRYVRVADGTLNSVVAHPREVFLEAIRANANAIVISHNHPSGDPTPSDADIKVTRDMIRAGELLKIRVEDHVILGTASTERPKDYSSLRELGFFYS